jgi:iron(III) transport system substrate-binding protein
MTIGTRRRRVAVRLALAALAGACALTLSACGSSGGSGLVIYSGQHEQTTNSLVVAFEKATGISVSVRYDDEDLLASTIVTEGHNSPADVIYTENSPALQYLAGLNLLAPVASATLSATPSRFNSPDGDWVGVSARVSVIIYNPSLISSSALPTSVMQLADPRYAGELAFSATETDFQPIITAVVRTYGQARALTWLEGIKANSSGNLYPDNETIADEVNRGQVAFGVINQYYWYRMRAEIGASNMHSRLAYFAPHDPGYVINVSGAGVLASAPHPADAQRFLAFLVSRAGQEIIAHSDSFEYPIADGVTTAAPETPFTDLKPYPITISQLGDGQLALMMLQRAGFI